MHERNIFKENPPNFQQLALEFEEFKPYLQIAASGKPYINFKDPASLRALSTVLLKKYFDISIEVPLDRLIPTIPLRLNYIHWIEDLIAKNENVNGIDIGCGASCVYALLGHQMNQWRFVVTEVDQESVMHAQNNINRNNASTSIQLKHVTLTDKILPPALELCPSTEIIDFTMCNPPFFDEVCERKDRTNRRPPPASVSTANDNETFTEGGEVMFVTKMIEESLLLKDKIRWFTTMLGKKSSLIKLKKLLNQQKVFITTSTFKQGRTMRWGLAWSFIEHSLKFTPDKKEKPPKPYDIIFSPAFFTKNNICEKHSPTNQEQRCKVLCECTRIVHKELLHLEVHINESSIGATFNKDIHKIYATAFRNTWIYERSRRRHEQRNKVKISSKCARNELLNATSTKDKAYESKVNLNEESSIHVIEEQSTCLKRSLKQDSSRLLTKKVKLDETLVTLTVPIFKFSCLITKKCLDDTNTTPVLTLLCLEGDRDQFHQLCLYLNNRLK